MSFFDNLLSKKENPDKSGQNITKEDKFPKIDVMDDVYYIISSSDELRTLKSTIGFNTQLNRLIWFRVQFKKDKWISVGIDAAALKMSLLQGKNINIKDADKSWINKMETEVGVIAGSGHPLVRDEEEIRILKIIASDRISKILKAKNQ